MSNQENDGGSKSNLTTIVKQLIPLTGKIRNGEKVTQEFIPVYRLYFDMLEGDIWACVIMSEIMYLQESDGGLENGGWVVWTFETISKNYYISRHIFNQSAEKLVELGLEKELRFNHRYPEAIKGVWHYRINEDKLAQATINYLESQPVPPSKIFTTPPEGISHITEVTLTEEKKNSSRAVPAQDKSTILSRPVFKESVSGVTVEPVKKSTPLPSTWLAGTIKTFFGKAPTDKQIEAMSKRVYAVTGTHSGAYLSPMEFSESDRYGTMFREWVMEKKDPRKNPTGHGGASRWITTQLMNYDSPEGFLTWASKRGVVIEPMIPDSITVIEEFEENEIYGLVEMDYICYNRTGSPKMESQIAPEFRAFYAENIGKVKSNEEFKQLWEE